MPHKLDLDIAPQPLLNAPNQSLNGSRCLGIEMPEDNTSEMANATPEDQLQIPDEVLRNGPEKTDDSVTGISVPEDRTSLTQTPPTRSPFWGKAREVLSGASTRASSAGAAMASTAASIGAAGVTKTTELGKQTYSAAGAAVTYIDSELEDRGAKQAIKSTAGAVVGKLDEVTGKRLLELLETRLQKQDTYNNVLATRLAEALDRITALEAQIIRLNDKLGTGHEPAPGDAT